ncbi:hypothetical protein [Streptomyces hainanensis]|uniref:WXG100 family type VII secretion target n=1 Tax=Streptomyces hainanensis TaxID=402648 RepID=A0A4R4T8C6_9ACTN|nr:hypothetical protein [Streptomyces hainanensis]TDC73421.1 hypothetical protein E1283_19230 [Streptomyces hainanensis]
MSFLRFMEDDVREMARQLAASGEELRSASRRLANTEAGEIGTPGLAGQCEDFADSWDYGFGQLSDLTRGIGDVANNAADAFTQADQDLERTAREARTGAGS